MIFKGKFLVDGGKNVEAHDAFAIPGLGYFDAETGKPLRMNGGFTLDLDEDTKRPIVVEPFRSYRDAEGTSF